MSDSAELTPEQAERLSRLETLEEEYQVDEEEATRKALQELQNYGFADLERFIEATEEEFGRVADRFGDLVADAPAMYPAVEGEDPQDWVSEEERSELRSSEDYLEYRKEELKYERRLTILRSREKAARELRRRHLYGVDMPELDEPDIDFDERTKAPDRTYDRRIWALRHTEPGSSVKSWIENALELIERTGRYVTRKPESVQRTLRSQLKDRYDPGRLDLGTFKELIFREAKRLSVPAGPDKEEKTEAS